MNRDLVPYTSTAGEGGRPQLTVQGVFKGKSRKQGVTCLGIVGLDACVAGGGKKGSF